MDGSVVKRAALPEELCLFSSNSQLGSGDLMLCLLASSTKYSSDLDHSQYLNVETISCACVLRNQWLQRNTAIPSHTQYNSL